MKAGADVDDAEHPARERPDGLYYADAHGGRDVTTVDPDHYLAGHPHARRFVRSVWDKLAELERSGQHPEAIDALRRVLTHHQPTTAGRCHACRRWTSRRPPFPCIVWHQIRGELLGQFTDGGRHRQPTTRT